MGTGQRRVITIHQNPLGIARRIVILAGFQAPDIREQSQCSQGQRHRYQNDEDVHLAAIFTRMAFTSTVIEEADIAMAAKNGVAKPAMAIGIAIAL